MKCIQYLPTGEITRTLNEDAAYVIKATPSLYRYVPKSAWREQNRPKSMSVGRQQAERYAYYAKNYPDDIFAANPKAEG